MMTQFCFPLGIRWENLRKKACDMKTVGTLFSKKKFAHAFFVLQTLEEAGAEAYIVGGAVRDALLDKSTTDIDIATSCNWQETEKLFIQKGARVVRTGTSLGSLLVSFPGWPETFEITTYRIEGVYGDKRHPDEIRTATTLQEDLSRRDFSINALAYNPKIGLIDEVGGVNALKRRHIKTVGDPYARFSEDALRSMRAVRFSAELGFEIEEATKEALFSCAPLLQDISSERIGKELEKLLVGPYAYSALSMYGKVLIPVFSQFASKENYNCDFKTYGVLVAFSGGVLSKDVAWAAFLYDMLGVCAFQKADACLKAFAVSRPVRKNVLFFLSLLTKRRMSPYTLASLCVSTFGRKKASRMWYKTSLLLLASRCYYKNYDNVPALLRKNIPLTTSELPFSGDDLRELGIDGSYISSAKEALLLFVHHQGRNISRETLLTKAETWFKNVTSLYSFLTNSLPHKHSIGLELERFVVTDKNKTVFYTSSPGIEELLRTWYEMDSAAKPLYENGKLMGLFQTLTKDEVGLSVTLEPGSQLEFSIGPATSTNELYFALEAGDVLFKKVTAKMGVSWRLLAGGINPYEDIASRIPLLPKERYHIMDAYFDTGMVLNEHAQDMMRRTASTQISLDLPKEETVFKERFKLALALEPALYLLGELLSKDGGKKRRFSRMNIWNAVDPARTDFPASLYKHPSYKAYVSWLLLTPALFDLKDPQKPAKAGRLITEDMLEEKLSHEQLTLIASSVFGPIRLKGLMELRVPDSVEPFYAAGISAFIETLFYDKEAFLTAFSFMKCAHLTKARVVSEKKALSSNPAQTYKELIALLHIAIAHARAANLEFLCPLLERIEKTSLQ